MLRDELTSDEIQALIKFESAEKRSEREIVDFIKMIIALREMPDKNPQLKGDNNGNR